MDSPPLHCTECARTYEPDERPGGRRLHCAACGGRLDPAPTERASSEEEPFRGRKIGQARLKKLLSVHPTHRVYRAPHSELKTDVRVEVYPAAVAEEDPAYIRLLFGRAAAAREVRSAHVASVLDLARLTDCLFIMSEYVPRRLSERLDAGRRLPAEQALRTMEAALRGLADLEREGALHGDVRPETVLIRSDGSVKLDRPGAVHRRELNRFTVNEAGRVGSPAFYVAPERAFDERGTDVRSDLYSLGATAFHVLAGKPPFDGESPQEIMTRHVDGPAPDLHAAAPGLPEPLCRFVSRLMATDPADRPQDARQALDALYDCAGEMGVARLPDSAEPAGRGVVRRSLAWTVVALVLLIAGIVPFVWMYRRHVAERKVEPSPHRTLLLVRPGGLNQTPLPDPHARALEALIAYRVGFYPRLEMLHAVQGGQPAQQAVRLQEMMAEEGASHALVALHEPGLRRRNWTVAFVHPEGEGWSIERKCSVPEGTEDWEPLEGALADMLKQAALRLGLSVPPGAESSAGATRTAWAAMATARRAERDGRLKDALQVLQGAGSDAAPFILLRTFYAAADEAVRTGELAVRGEVPAEGLSPELAGLGRALRAVRDADPPSVRAAFADYLAEFPRSARGYFLLGLWRLRIARKPEEALVALKHASRLDPGYLPAAHACVDLMLRSFPEGLDSFLQEYAEMAPSGDLGQALQGYADRTSAQ